MKRRIPNESIDVIVTSPPYNIGINYNSHKDNMPFEKYLKWMKEFSQECSRVLKDSGSLFLNIGDKPSDNFRAFDVASEFKKTLELQNTIHWIKSIAIPEKEITLGHYKPVNSRRFLGNFHEYVFHFTKNRKVMLDKLSLGVPYKHKSNVTRWKKEKRDLRERGNVWFIKYETINGQRGHPAIFPVKLPEMCIKLHGLESSERIVVLDPFIGSGSTAVAAKRLGCDYVGFDVDKDYVKFARTFVKKHP